MLLSLRRLLLYIFFCNISIKAFNSTLRLTFQLNSLVRVSRRVEQLYLLSFLQCVKINFEK